MTDVTAPVSDAANNRGFAAYVLATDGFKKQMKHGAKVLDRSERKVHALVSKVARAESEMAITAEALRRANERQAVADADRAADPQVGPRGSHWMPAWMARLVALAAVLLLFVVDSQLLLFLGESVWKTRGLTFVIVAASAGTAWVWGTLRRTWADEEFPDITLGPSHRATIRVMLVLGVGIEVTLAIVRAIAASALLTSILLGAAGVGLWFVVGYSVMMAHDATGAVAGRAERIVKRSARRRQKDQAYAVSLRGKLELSQQALTRTAATEFATFEHMLDGGAVVWSRTHPDPDRPTWPWLHRIEAVADGHLPACCRLPESRGGDLPELTT